MSTKLLLFISLLFLVFPDLWSKSTLVVFSHFSATKSGKNETKLLGNWRNLRKVRKHFSGVVTARGAARGDHVHRRVPVFSYWRLGHPRKQELSSRLPLWCPGITVNFEKMDIDILWVCYHKRQFVLIIKNFTASEEQLKEDKNSLSSGLFEQKVSILQSFFPGLLSV